MQPTTVLFDLDGTLIDHFGAIHRCHVYTMQQLGLPPPTMAEIHAAVGGGIELAVERLVGPELMQAALAVYRPHWDATMLEDVDLLPGALELLDALRQRGTPTAVMTNKHGPSSRAICAHLGLDAWFDGNFGATDTPWLKPDRQFTTHVLTTLGADAATTLLVGDSTFDVETALNGGLDFIGVSTGTHPAAELYRVGAKRVCQNLKEVARELGLA